jgi:hypothetical protein
VGVGRGGGSVALTHERDADERQRDEKLQDSLVRLATDEVWTELDLPDSTLSAGAPPRRRWPATCTR